MSVAQLERPDGKAGLAPEVQRLVFYAVDWRSYEKFLEAVGDRRIRLTYDRGTLEIMTIGAFHDWWKRRIGLLMPILGREVGKSVQGFGSTTLRREDVGKGLEPDEGFYVGRGDQMAGPMDIDLSRDPPPDLGLEIDIYASSLNRMDIYAALRVPEVWRFDGENLYVYRLLDNGSYEQVERSVHFPTLPLTDFVQFLRTTQKLTEDALIEPFVEWVRANVLPGLQSNGNGA
jgi:Uma2 family endonuclease